MRGVISEVEQHPEWKSWSFKLSGNNTWFRAGKYFTFKQGDSIDFEAEVVGKSTRANKINPWKGASESASVPAATVASTAPGARTQAEYWAAREARDIDTQKRIELQSCRNSALELVKLLTSEAVGAIKLPAKQADKARVAEELVAHYTELFLKENKTGKPGESGEPSESSVDTGASEPAAPINNTKESTTNNDDDNWN